MWSSHAISLFCQVYFWCFWLSTCQIVRWDSRILTLSVCIHNLPIPQFYFSILPKCQVHSTLWTAGMCLLICFCWAPENHTAPVISVFSTGCLELLPLFSLLFLFIVFFHFWLDGPLKLERSPFKIEIYPQNYVWK